MPITKTNLPIPLSQGLSTKVDPKQTGVGQFTTLQNALFQTPKELRKRPGFAALTQNIQGGGTITNGLGLTTYNKELIELDGFELYSYNASGPNWVNKGRLPLTNVTTSSVIKNNYAQTSPDIAVNGSLQLNTWSDSEGAIRYSIFDTQTNQSLVDNQLIDATGLYARALAVGSFLVIVYSGPRTTIKYKSINTSAPTVLSAATTITTNLNNTSTTPSVFDATVINNTIYIAYSEASGDNVGVQSLSSVLVLSSAFSITLLGTKPNFCLNVFGDVSGNVWISYDSNFSSQSLNLSILNSTLTAALLTDLIIDNNFHTFENGSNAANVTGVVNGTTCNLFYEINNPPTTPDPLYANYIKQATCTITGTIGGPEFYVLGAGVTGRAFYYSGVPYFFGAFQSNLQSTYFLFQGNAVVNSSVNFVNLIAAKISSDLGGGLVVSNTISHVIALGGGEFQSVSLIKDNLISIGGTLFAQTGVISMTIDFLSVAPSKVVLGDNLLIASGLLEMYDGSSVVEHGYNIYPENVQETLSTSGGSLGPGTSGATSGQIQYSVVYAWDDNQGQNHQSAPSIPVSVVLTPNIQVITDTGTISHNSNQVTGVTNAASLSVGQFVNFLPNSSYVNPTSHDVGGTGAVGFLENSTITVISGTTITLSSTYDTTSLGPVGSFTFIVTNMALGYGEITVSTTNKTGNTTHSSGLASGQAVYITSPSLFSSGTYITNVSGTAVTFNQFPAVSNISTFAFTFYTFDVESVTLQIPTLRLTAKTNVVIEIYRTTFNGTTFFRINNPTTPLFNNPQVDFITYTDTSNDFTIIGNEELYTTGGVLENIEVDAPELITTFKSRAIVVPSESQTQWEFGQQVIPGTPETFNDALIQNTDSSINYISAVGVLDEKIILFGPSSHYYVVGDGPASTGLNNDFIYPQRIAGLTGCQNQASIINIPEGLIYQDANKGIYLLDRSLSEQYIGSPVEAFNSQTVTSATLIPEFEMVRFTLNSGTTLTYDYIMRQWSADIYPSAAVDACVFENTYCYLTSSGQVNEETPGVFSDNGAVIPMSMEFGWMNFADIEAFMRVYQFMIFGEYKSPHTLTVNIYYDYINTISQTIIIPVLSDPGPYQFRLQIARQKCEAIRIQIIESQPGAPGEGFSLSGIAFRIAVKSGLNKVPAAVSY